MKLLPPILALLLVVAWLGTQRRSINTVEKEVIILRERIRDARISPDDIATDPSLASRVSRNPAGKPGTPIDWKQVASDIAAQERGRTMPDMRAMMSLQRRLMEMTADEICTALDEIAALEITEEASRHLESMMLGALVEQDPQMALERFADRLGDRDGRLGWQLANAMRRWAQDDPAAAGKWLDQKVADGAFATTSLDGRSQSRIRFEAAMIGAMLADKPQSASQRLAAMPADQRSMVLHQGGFLALNLENAKPFATMVREHLDEGEGRDVLAQAVTRIARNDEDHERVDTVLAQIDASPAERGSICSRVVERTLRDSPGTDGFNRETVDDLRQWLARQVPDQADSITGQTLARTSNDIEHGIAMITELHAETGSDDLLTAFLGDPRALESPELALPLVDRISDPELREQTRQQFTTAGRPAHATEIHDAQ